MPGPVTGANVRRSCAAAKTPYMSVLGENMQHKDGRPLLHVGREM